MDTIFKKTLLRTFVVTSFLFIVNDALAQNSQSKAAKNYASQNSSMVADFPLPPKSPVEARSQSNEKDWIAYDRKMVVYNSKMKTLESKINEHFRLMEEFNKKNIPLTKEMFEFDQKLKEFLKNGGTINGC
jgi:hypothetical protein